MTRRRRRRRPTRRRKPRPNRKQPRLPPRSSRRRHRNPNRLHSGKRPHIREEANRNPKEVPDPVPEPDDARLREARRPPPIRSEPRRDGPCPRHQTRAPACPEAIRGCDSRKEEVRPPRPRHRCPPRPPRRRPSRRRRPHRSHQAPTARPSADDIHVAKRSRLVLPAAFSRFSFFLRRRLPSVYTEMPIYRNVT